MKTICNCATVVLVLGFGVLAQASAPAGRYTVDSNTVYDNKTKLTWEKNGTGATAVWSSAQAYCSNRVKDLGGTGWRLPTVKELLSIVDFSAQPPATDPALPLSWAKELWSATPVAGDSSSAWSVSFSSGEMTKYAKNTLLYARCVR